MIGEQVLACVDCPETVPISPDFELLDWTAHCSSSPTEEVFYVHWRTSQDEDQIENPGTGLMPRDAEGSSHAEAASGLHPVLEAMADLKV